jgi:hypothetical protein
MLTQLKIKIIININIIHIFLTQNRIRMSTIKVYFVEKQKKKQGKVGYLVPVRYTRHRKFKKCSSMKFEIKWCFLKHAFDFISIHNLIKKKSVVKV